RRLAPEPHSAGVEVPREINDLGHRHELLAQPLGHDRLELLFLLPPELLAPLLGQVLPLRLGKMRLEERRGDLPRVDAQPDVQVALAEDLAVLDLEIEHVLDRAPPDAAIGVLERRERPESAEPQALDEGVPEA